MSRRCRFEFIMAEVFKRPRTIMTVINRAGD